MIGDHSHRPELLMGSDTCSQEPILGNTSKYSIFQKLQHGTIHSDGSWLRDTRGTQVVLSRNYMAGAGEQSHQRAIWIGLIKISLNIPRTQLWLFLTNRIRIIVRAKTDRQSLDRKGSNFT